MAKITKSLSTKGTDSRQILLRVVVNRNTTYRLKSGFHIQRKYWNETLKDFKIPRDALSAKEPKKIKNSVEALCLRLYEHIDSCQDSIPSKFELEKIINDFHNEGEKGTTTSLFDESDFFGLFDKFMHLNIKRTDRWKQFMVLRRMLLRFLCYRNSAICLDFFSSEDMHSFHDFLEKEHTFFDKNGQCLKKYQFIYEQYPEARIKPRGENAIHSILKRFRTFYNWAYKNKFCKSNPFKTYKLRACVYGTPFYLTKEERNKLYEFDLSARPALAIQRDIFVFQSLVGMRIGDLYGLTSQNIVHKNGKTYVHYIPSKTLRESGNKVSVPLTKQATEILSRYNNTSSTLLPFISEQKYNKSIKEALRLAGIDRVVTILNPTTRKVEHKKICDVASSHMARRNFIGILYSQVKDPSLIASMTGHVEGSQAFARYRDIEDSVKEETVGLL